MIMDYFKTRLDLTGQKFGRLTVLEPAENVGRDTAWRCRCECGSEAVVKTGNLRSGNVRSCGCLRDDYIRGKRLDLTGQVFGRLTALERAEGMNGHTAWRCRCGCGNETVVRTGSLLSGSAKSCGCQEHARRNDLTGRTFGRLTVLEPVKNKYGQASWRCRCGCGNETVVRTWDLTSGHVASCGCLKDAAFGKSEGADEDLTGRVFGKLTVLGPAGTVKGNSMWRCRCECGKETVVRGSGLRTGNTRSCGCLRGRPRKRQGPPDGAGGG